ncbi:MAG: ABC transporter permease [Lachnospiraceae bacterium]|jgi:peptide/nickel transport system permease protein|nr:ABC transporter permease [Lachnospiraceae bacterium]NBJ80483.1 ABC transporter permease [bacterium 1XD42-76]NBK03692.1 ABC transporter permease [bacterium 1XD42-94]
MSNTAAVHENEQISIKKKSQIVDVWKRLCRNKTAVLGLIIVAILVLIAIFAPIVLDYENQVIKTDYGNALKAPCAAHPFGTDEMGRDILVRVLYATSTSLSIGVVTVIVSLTVGLILGSAAGYFGGKVDMIIMRIMDIFLAIPGILLAICIVASLGNSIINLVIAQAVSAVPTFARVVRGAVMTVRDAEYVEAARAIGAKDSTIIFHDVLPNSLAPIIVQTTLQVASVILSIAGLSFIGLGIPAPRPEWGAMLSASRAYIRDYSYMCLFPGAAIMITILSLNLLGDGLRDALDPRLR